MHRTVKTADRLKERHQRKLEALATRRVEIAVKEWRRAFPDRQLDMLFGMGSEYITIDGRYAYDHYMDDRRLRTIDGGRRFDVPSVDAILRPMIADVLEICDWYKSACPEDGHHTP